MKGKFLLILPLILGTLMAGIDSSIVNISLPTMQSEFGVDLDQIQWVITAYMLGFCVFMPLTNWLKERMGYYNLYLISLAVFTVGSLMCAISRSLETLILARAIQSFGGGAITPTAMAIITAVFPANERGKVMGWWSIGSIAGPAIGPTIGGILTAYYGWPSIFYINLPIGIITMVIAGKSLRFLNTLPKAESKFDLKGFSLFTVFIVFFQYAIAIISIKGITSPWFFTPLILSFVAIYYFIKISNNNPRALFNLNIFKHSVYIRCILITVVRSIAIFGGLFMLPFLLQGELGYSEIKAGLMILPFSFVMAILTPYAGSLSDRIGPRKLVVPGLIIAAASMVSFGFINSPNEVPVILSMVLRGLGLGLLVSTLSASAMSSVLPSEVTYASSMYSLMQQLGGSIGIAFSSLIQQFMLNYYHVKGYADQVANHFAIQDVFLISAVLVLASIFLAFKLPNAAVVKNINSGLAN